MSDYVKKSLVVDAKRFNPMDYPWPEGVTPWTDTHPRDASYGYILTPEGKQHVWSGSWIIAGAAGEKSVCSNENFLDIYRSVLTIQASPVSMFVLNSEQEKRVRAIVRDELVRCVRNSG